MKLLRHILSHLILISFLIAVFSVFYYRMLLFPSYVVSEIDEVTNSIYPPALKFVSKRDYFWSIKGERIVSFDDLNFFNKGNKASPEKETQNIVVADKNNGSSVETGLAIKPKEKGKLSAKDEIATNATTEVQEDNKKDKAIIATVVPEEIKPSPENKDKEVPFVNNNKSNKAESLPLVVIDRNTSSERNLLISARKAFNQGKPTQSETFYLELIQLDNDNPDIYGELGNVYYSQGKWNEAGQTYYEAAVRLIAEGKYNQVSYLQRVISGMNTEYAEKLSQLMKR